MINKGGMIWKFLLVKLFQVLWGHLISTHIMAKWKNFITTKKLSPSTNESVTTR